MPASLARRRISPTVVGEATTARVSGWLRLPSWCRCNTADILRMDNLLCAMWASAKSTRVPRLPRVLRYSFQLSSLIRNSTTKHPISPNRLSPSPDALIARFSTKTSLNSWKNAYSIETKRSNPKKTSMPPSPSDTPVKPGELQFDFPFLSNTYQFWHPKKLC